MIEAKNLIKCNYKMDSEENKNSLEIVGKVLPVEEDREIRIQTLNNFYIKLFTTMDNGFIKT
jgi:hypothetical protein